jgi:Spy/CpxP family protein refolding chaperone
MRLPAVMKRGIILAAVGLAITAAVAVAHTPQRHQPYAGQQARTVSALSPEEMQAFLEGRGMGLARAAELNGYPGPMHVLELESELGLTPEQHRAVEEAFTRMQAKARDAGARYVAAERAVDAAFKSGSADLNVIADRVAEANRLLGEVRLAHLAAHLEITPLLTPEQRARYAELRGYGASHQHQGPDRNKASGQ